MSKRYKAAVVGGSGYGGAELIRRLLSHPEVELVRVASIDYVGESLSLAHPNLEGQTDLRFEGITPTEAAKGVDVVFLGLPHKVSAQKMAELLLTDARIIDLSGDFRLRNADAYKKYYGTEHPLPQRLDGTFVYGLPEINREAIRRARYLASPGCFATTIELALLPLAKAGFLEGEIHVVGITGSSGSGVAPSLATHHPIRANNLRTYKPLEHQHNPEIMETLAFAGAKDFRLQFVPVSAPLTRGIFSTSFVRIKNSVPFERIQQLYFDCFEGEPFVRVPPKRLPEVAAVKGTNYAEVGVAKEGDGSKNDYTLICFSAIDNLVKGGAGQAIQSMNIMLGVDETLTLKDPGGWP